MNKRRSKDRSVGRSGAGNSSRAADIDIEDGGIEWKEYPRVEPGVYSAYCRCAKRYWDPAMRRWTCLLLWDLLDEAHQTTIAKSIPLWFALGDGEKPRASRRGKFLKAWVDANGNVPSRRDPLSLKVFVHRIAQVEVGDTNSVVPYSAVKRIICWQTGHSISKSTSQVWHSTTDSKATGSQQ
jgi:hypothetical protein